MNLAENLKKIRKDNNLSQEQLAEKLGVSRQSVSKWESNLAYPEMDKVLQICQMFNLNIDELLNQDIKEVQNNKQSKNNINKFIDDFLDYITKTIDMFSSMKFKAKIKCIFELLVVAGIIALLFVIIGLVCSNLLWNIVNLLPESINYIFYSLVSNIYRIICLFLGMVLVLHIFKVRYLDYYVIVKENDEVISKVENNEGLEVRSNNEKEKIVLEKKKEKIIIRDPKHSGYKFISGLLRCLLFFVKTFVFIVGILFCFSLICLVFCLVISFLFIKTGLLFIGGIFTLLSLIVLNLVVLIIIYNFIISRKNKKNRLALSFVLSLILIGVGIGMISIGITSFEQVKGMDNNNYVKEEIVINMEEDLFFNDYYGNIEYVLSSNDDIKIVYEHPKFYDIVMEDEDEIKWFHISYDYDFMEMMRSLISDINDKKITNYYSYKVYIHTNEENIDTIRQNQIDYFNNNR